MQKYESYEEAFFHGWTCAVEEYAQRLSEWNKTSHKRVSYTATEKVRERMLEDQRIKEVSDAIFGK